MALDLHGDVVELVAALVDIPSESRHEDQIATEIHQGLQACSHLSVTRDGNTVIARTDLGRPERVVVCGHIDTVPAAGNLPHSFIDVDGELNLAGLGSCDMKGGLGVLLHLAATVTEPTRDVTYICYEAEEIAEAYNGLNRLASTSPELLAGDFAILMEPSNAGVEAGCQGTLRAQVRVAGRRAHSARSWRGVNAIHEASEVLERLNQYHAARVVIDGLEYREGLNAVGISGGIAGNIIPDECLVTVNYRFAPNLSPKQAEHHVRAVFHDLDLTVLDLAAGAMPGLSRPAAAAFVEMTGQPARPKFGWTDVARFTALGVPAVNYGPGDPSLAHARDERVPVAQIRTTAAVMSGWLAGRS